MNAHDLKACHDAERPNTHKKCSGGREHIICPIAYAGAFVIVTYEVPQVVSYFHMWRAIARIRFNTRCHSLWGPAQVKR